MEKVTDLLDELRHFTYGQSSFNYMLEQSKQKRKQHFRCLIVHAPPHKKWATAIDREITQTFPSLLEGVEMSCTLLEISGSFPDVKEQLGEELDLKNITGTQQYAFIVTVGVWESNVVHRVREYAGVTTPQLHCMPNVPETDGVPLSSVRNKCPITGVYSHPTSAQEYIAMLTGIMPHMKKACIVFEEFDNDDDDHFLFTHKQRRTIQQAFRAAGIDTTIHYWSLRDPRLVDLELEAETTDAILLPNSLATYANIDAIRRIAIKHKVMLCSAELDSVISGAAIGAGIVGAGFAAPLMSQMVDAILGASFDAIAPIRIPQQSGLRYNFHAMEEQGVEISEQLSALLRAKSVYDKDTTEY